VSTTITPAPAPPAAPFAGSGYRQITPQTPGVVMPAPSQKPVRLDRIASYQKEAGR
jgi:hypothetical protein